MPDNTLSNTEDDEPIIDYLSQFKTDADFYDYMLAEERKILERIDPEGLAEMDEEERRMQDAASTGE
jgi:hydrogenase maturation factor HypF (carbamoyltransferase family)